MNEEIVKKISENEDIEINKKITSNNYQVIYEQFYIFFKRNKNIR